MIVISLTFLIAVAYIFWARKVAIGWKRYRKTVPNKPGVEKGISVVISYRNESHHLVALLQSLGDLKYDFSKVELILVNDHSEDQSAEIVKKWMHTAPCKMLALSSEKEGKKAAQKMGILHASHNIIACTDADCTVPETWLQHINQAFEAPEVKIVFGGVGFVSRKHPYQKLEFLSLIGSTLAMLKLGWPVMGNGANMAFKKEAYLNAFKQLNALATPSGDDVFLLHELSKEPNAVGVLPQPNSLVLTQPQPNISVFIQQRIRWASKAKKYQAKEAISVAVLVFLTNAWMLFLLIYPIFSGHFTGSFLLLFLTKSILDFFLLRSFSRFYNQPFKFLVFILLECANLIYIPLIGLVAPMAKFRWKGRQY